MNSFLFTDKLFDVNRLLHVDILITEMDDQWRPNSSFRQRLAKIAIIVHRRWLVPRSVLHHGNEISNSPLPFEMSTVVPGGSPK